MKIYEEKIALIESHNANASNTWKMGINQFTDLTEEEFVKTYLGETVPFTPLAI